eukprot:220908_1
MATDTQVMDPTAKDAKRELIQIQKTKATNIHKIPCQPIPTPTRTANQAPTIKLNNKMQKIQHTLIDNWIESGFIENMRGQIRCQLIRELQHPFKHQKGSRFQSNKSTNQLSLHQRILNSIIIDYLTTHSYSYSLSVFKSEIGGELIGSLSRKDTHSQLRLKHDDQSKKCILEHLINDNKTTTMRAFHPQILETPQLIQNTKQLEKLKHELEVKRSFKQERKEVQALEKKLKDQLRIIGKDESTKSEWKMKYQEQYKQLMETMQRENELQCLLDERDIKLTSAQREIDYLETLLNSQNKMDQEHDRDNKMSQLKQKTHDEFETKQNEMEEVQNETINTNTRPRLPRQKHDMSNKYEQLELDLKKRLKMQAMLETDTRKLTFHTKQFFNQLNQQKSKTNEIMNKLENTTPRLDDRDMFNKYQNLENEWQDYSSGTPSVKQEQLEAQKSRNRQSYIYYNLDQLQKERDQIQHNIRRKFTLKKERDIRDGELKMDPLDNASIQNEYADTSGIPSVCSTTDSLSIHREMHDENDSEKSMNSEHKEDEETITETIDHETKTNDMESSLPVIEEDKEHLSKEIDMNHNTDGLDASERERLEREKFEEDFLDDYAQSESFSGVDFLQNDFLEQYQKHIENMKTSD